MQNDILFDNIYIGHSIADAEALQKETFDVKVAVEKQEEEQAKPKKDDTKKPASPMDLKFTDDPVHYVTEKFNLFMEIAKRDPVQAVRFVPEIAGGLAVGAITLILLLGGLLAGGSKAAPTKEQINVKAQQAKDAALKTKDQVAEAVATGTQQAKDEVNKRSNRNSTVQ